MLAEIKSDSFRKKLITFHTGLNIVLGDEKASNSIGKSNLLLIIDFVFGGDTYLTHSKDVIEHLGEHFFYFCFKFDMDYKFKRSTDNPEIVFKCDEDYNVDSSITIENFTKFLQDKYNISYSHTTFRALIGGYSRIWGKDNYNIRKPLKTYGNDGSEKVGIDNLIKLFNRYNELDEINEKIKNDGESKKILDGMYKNNYATKITKTQFNKNNEQIIAIKEEIENIQSNILKYLLNIEEVINKDVLSLKTQKNDLLSTKNNYDNQLLRINENLKNKVNLNIKHLNKLQEFFPNSNIKEINQIEGFHSKIKKILSAEIDTAKNLVEAEIDDINQKINLIDIKIAKYLEHDTNPKHVMDKVYELTLQLNTLQNTNHFYEEKENKVVAIKSNKVSLSEKQALITAEIKEKINTKMLEMNKDVYSNDNSPIFNLENNKYLLAKNNDTGTGTGETSLILFDLAVFNLTNLPILIHDSVIFKDISIDTMEKIITLYDKNIKQIFISMDEPSKYTNIKEILDSKKVIELDENNTLFAKKWNNEKQTIAVQKS